MRAAKLRDSYRRIGFEHVDSGRELVVHRPAHRVASAGAIERDARHYAAFLVMNGAVGTHALSSHGERSAASADNTLSVCSPNNGGARHTVPGVSSSLTGMPRVRTWPSTGGETTSTMRRAAVCGASNTCA